MSLAERLEAARIPKVQENDVNEWEVSPSELSNDADVQPINSNQDAQEFVQSNEFAPSPEVETSINESPVVTATSRIGRFLQRVSDRVENGANRADKASEFASDTTELAKTKLRSIGRVAARFGSASREVGVGVRVLAANKVADVGRRVDAAVQSAAESATGAVKDKATAISDRTGEAIMNGFAKVETGLDTGAAKMVEFKAGVKEKLIARKTAALARRQARRERWAARRDGIKDTVNNRLDRTTEGIMNGFAKVDEFGAKVGNTMISAKESAANKAERAKQTIRTTRTIGRIAIDARKA